ncbi:MAG: hypothetical protein JZU65_20380, partial [Chlorobium sp.]|nr:hypothetical protein [Chlorobium sp.]
QANTTPQLALQLLQG